jgi:tetratricopeptide (TPR) repeat protein
VSSVTLCVIARNEAGNLPACLAPLVPLVRETVIVDTGSTDATRTVAESFGARVFQFPWCDDFAAARNESLRRATGDWILWMDADDRLDAENVRRLAELLGALANEPLAYLMSCVSLASDGQPTFAAKHVRLFPRAPAHLWARRVHEQILPALRATGCELHETGIVVHHVGYQDHALFLRKIERNLRLLELEYASRPPDGWYFYQRGGALFDLGRFAEAIVSLHLALPLAAADGAPRIHALLAEAYAHEQPTLDDALAEVQRGRARFPSEPELLVLEAQILGAMGEFAAMDASLTASLELKHQSGPFAIWDATVGLRSRHLLARMAFLDRRIDVAEAHLKAILAERPAFGPAVLTLGECLLAKGDEVAFDTLRAGIPDAPETATGQAVMGAMRAVHRADLDAALAILDAGLDRDPESAFLAKARVLALVRAGRAEARSALESLLRAHPLDLEARAVARRTGALA